jgi:hypothetical protein
MTVENAPLETAPEHVESVKRLTKDILAAADKMGKAEIRYLVDGYYSIQEYRKASGNQVRSTVEAGEPALVLRYLAEQAETLEGQIKRALDRWTNAQKVGRWCRSHVGIGPVITAGMLAHIDIRKAPTAGHIYSFAGLDPTVKWEKGEKRPWNARLKVLCWKLGDSFVKFHNREDCFYGKLYAERKVLEVERNQSGALKDQAAKTLVEKKIKDKATREKYESGQLPDGRIDLRARRYAVKIFLSHLHHVLYLAELGTPPPVPYAFTKGGHAHFIVPPNLDELER